MRPYLQRTVRASLFLLIVLVLAAFTPGTVFAEGEIPETPPPEPILEPAPEPDTASAVQTLAEAGAVIVEESGAFTPLASQKALAGLGDPDPWFYCSACAGGKATYLGVNSLTTALSDWAAKKGYGFIYLEGGYLQTSVLNISGIDPGMGTLKGLVWDKTTPGAKPRLNAPTNIVSFKNGFTLQGISMTASSALQALQLNGNKGTIRLTDVDVTNPTGSGIVVVNQGSIFLTNVQVIDSNGYGAYLNNTYYDASLGKYINTGNITVTNSVFLRNGGPADSQNHAGLYPVSAGNIVLNGVVSNGNYGNGATILAVGPSIIIRNSTFSNNSAVPNNDLFGHGIYFNPGGTANITLDNVYLFNNENSGAVLSTTGNVTLKMVNASYNGRHGVRIASHPISESLGAKNVIVQNSNFYRNFVTGLVMFTSGAVKVSNVSSTNTSSGAGLLIDNSTYAASPMPVSVMGAVLNDNFTMGLLVRSKGNITVAGITALENGFTSQLRNNYPNTTGSVIISGALGLNQFNDTTEGSGLVITTLRNVNVSSLQANGNPDSGLSILAEGPASNVTLTNVEISGNDGLNSSPGITITATGNVILDRLAVSENGREGVAIDNSIALTPRLVRISNSTANGNGREGIVVISVGAISLVNVTASSNSLNGATLTNRVTTLLPQGITVQKSTFDNNGARGLLLESQRTISLVSINASYNASNGLQANNAFGGSTSPIVITGVNRIISNGLGGASNGMNLNTNGALTLSGITVSWSGFNGIGASSGSVQNTLRNIVVQGNNQNGIHLITLGNTVLNGITSIQNSQDGVRISANTAKVTITNSTVLANGVYGLSFNVNTPATDVYVAPSTVVLGNTSGNFYIY